MRFNWSLGLAFLGTFSASTTAAEEQEVKNVAIIGAGAAGSSAAYYLQQYAQEEGLAVNITIFERTGRIGGRTLTKGAYNDPLQPIELGASIFITANYILVNASRDFNLTVSVPHDPTKGDITAIWDGQKFVYQSAEGTSWWWDALKLWWKYGYSPYKAVNLVKSVIDVFLKLYEPPYFPFRSLTQRSFELGLSQITSVTGEQLFNDAKIDQNFARDIIQTASRVNYASNLAFIHGLEALVSFATDDVNAVVGGNWQIFEQMISQSGASLYRNTSVASISLAEKKDGAPQYLISTKDATSHAATSEDHGLAFDNIIIAAPWQFSKISAGDGVLQHTIDEIPYMKLHVTLFTSPLKLHGEYFGLEPGAKVPSNVYTTLPKDEVPKQGPDSVGSPGFYSISTLKTVVNPKTQQREYAYKIFSPEVVTAEFLSKILGTKIPDTFTSTSQDSDDKDDSTFEPITWYHPYWFWSYPIELPRVTFQDPIVGQGLYYTSGMESFISCMETSALSGKNVARLIADDFAGISRKEPEVYDVDPSQLSGEDRVPEAQKPEEL